jgi:carboxyl-terminal processing protease
MARFKTFLEKRDFTFTDAEFEHDRKWLTEQIRDEFYLRAFDKKTSDRAQFADDPEVQKAVDNLPKAANMLSEAQKVMAARRQ